MRFLRDQSGAVSVEYAVLCAVTAGLGAATLAVLQMGTSAAGENIAANSENSAQIVQPRVRVIHDQVFMAEVYDALGLLTEEELAVITAWFDDMVAVVKADPDAYDEALKKNLTDFDTAIQLTWGDYGSDRPTDGTWTQAQIDALPGELTHTY
jgi:Flp pilus assembly pilin Flp